MRLRNLEVSKLKTADQLAKIAAFGKGVAVTVSNPNGRSISFVSDRTTQTSAGNDFVYLGHHKSPASFGRDYGSSILPGTTVLRE